MTMIFNKNLEQPQNLNEQVDESSQSELEIQSAFAEELKKETLRQLEIIGPDLRDFSKKVISEKPDFIVFLDKSTRVFGVPYFKYLKEIMGNTVPEIRYLNDDNIKGDYLMSESNTKLNFSNVFADYKDKKIFFVDETFSEGKGAVALYLALKGLGVNFNYTAFSEDPEADKSFDTRYAVSEVDHNKNLEDMMLNASINIYPNRIKNLFSRPLGGVEVGDTFGDNSALVSISNFEKKDSKVTNNIPSSYNYVKLPEGMTLDEYRNKSSQILLETTRFARQKIYEELNK